MLNVINVIYCYAERHSSECCGAPNPSMVDLIEFLLLRMSLNNKLARL
jgi:hypothetical protein